MQQKSLWERVTQKIGFKKNKPHTLRIQRSDHPVSRRNISPNALKVLLRLHHEGFQAYLVGGGVRDLLLDRKPKDFDIVTDAEPEKVHAIFRNSRLIGRRFRLVHIYYHGEIIEVSTFRANNENVYGTIEEDAWRRDFTINALYYSIADFSVMDYTGGLKDLHEQTIRMIGDPEQRFREDPVRLLRAIRLAAKLDFKLEANTEKSLRALSTLLRHVPHARLFDEYIKLFLSGYAFATYRLLENFGFLKNLFPEVFKTLKEHPARLNGKLIELFRI